MHTVLVLKTAEGIHYPFVLESNVLVAEAKLEVMRQFVKTYQSFYIQFKNMHSTIWQLTSMPLYSFTHISTSRCNAVMNSDLSRGLCSSRTNQDVRVRTNETSGVHRAGCFRVKSSSLCHPGRKWASQVRSCVTMAIFHILPSVAPQFTFETIGLT